MASCSLLMNKHHWIFMRSHMMPLPVVKKIVGGVARFLYFGSRGSILAKLIQMQPRAAHFFRTNCRPQDIEWIFLCVVLQDVRDPRFSALYENPLYNVDPSAPEFKRSKTTEAILDEKVKRRTKKHSAWFALHLWLSSAGYFFVDNVLAHVRNSPMKDASPLVKDEETKKSIFFAVIVACWHGERPATSFVQSVLWPAMAPAFRLNWLTAFSTGSSIIIATRTHGLLLKSCRSFPSGVKSYNLWLLVV